MSIVTKTGDQGQTSLMYQRRVSKCHPRVEAYGDVDELNATIGVARACAKDAFVSDHLMTIQKNLVILMGELATAIEDLGRYVNDGFSRVSPELTAGLEAVVLTIEAEKITFRGWATPGGSVGSAALDVARTVCRRAERSVCALQQAGQLDNSEILIYLNRLSDLLWLLARWTEKHAVT